MHHVFAQLHHSKTQTFLRAKCGFLSIFSAVHYLFCRIDIIKYVIYGIASAFFVYGILLMVEGFFTSGAIKDLYGDFKITTCGRCVSAWVGPPFFSFSTALKSGSDYFCWFKFTFAGSSQKHGGITHHLNVRSFPRVSLKGWFWKGFTKHLNLVHHYCAF